MMFEVIKRYHAPLSLDLANDDEYQEDRNKEESKWEGRRKKCIPLFVVQTILKYLLITVSYELITKSSLQEEYDLCLFAKNLGDTH